MYPAGTRRRHAKARYIADISVRRTRFNGRCFNSFCLPPEAAGILAFAELAPELGALNCGNFQRDRPVEYRNLGRAGVKVSSPCLGSMLFGHTVGEAGANPKPGLRAGFSQE